MDRRQFIQRAMSSRSSSSSGTSSSTTATKKDSSYSNVAALPLSDSNASSLRRKSMSFSHYNTKSGSDGHNSPSIVRPANSPLNRSLVSTASAPSSPPLPNRKPVNNSPLRFYRQRSSEEIQSRGRWPASKKKNDIPAPDAGTETLGSFIDEDRRIEAEDRPTATYNSSTFSFRQRISSSDPSASTPENRGRRSLRYHLGKLRVENQLKNPGTTPPSPSSSSSSSSSGPPPSAPALPGRLSFHAAALTKKRSDSGLDIPSIESETAGRTPRLSRELSRRLESPVTRSRSPVKGRSSGVGSLISQGLSNLFRRKSFHHAESPKPLPNAAAAGGAGSPVREVVKPTKANSSPRRDNVAAGRSIGPIGSPASGAALVEGETQHKLRMMQCYLTQWRFVNAAALEVDQNKWAITRGTVISTWLGLSDLQLLVARKRVQLLREKHGFRLKKLLYHQTQALDQWETTEGQYMAAISSTKDSLQTAVCRVPLTDHAKADPHILSILLKQTTNLAAAISENIAKCNSGAQRTAPSVAELAEVVAKERLLVEESYELLGLLSSLQVREESLRCQLIQLKSGQVEQAAVVVEKDLLAV